MRGRHREAQTLNGIGSHVWLFELDGGEKGVVEQLRNERLRQHTEEKLH